MQIFVEGNGVRYIDGDINFLTAKGNLTPIKEGNLTISFRNNITPQKTFNVADVRNAANATYGVTADAVILALSSLVFNDANGGGGGAVSSVNSQTGAVTVNLDNVLAQNGEYVILKETSNIADFVAGQTHYYIGKAPITFDYDLLPYPLPAPISGFNLVNQSVFDVTITSDGGNTNYLLKPNQSMQDIQVTDNGGAWLVLPTQYFDNLYNLQETTDKGNVTTNPVIVRNNPDTYRTRYSILGQGIQRDDLGFNLNYYDTGITKIATGSKTWALQIPDLTANANSSAYAVVFRPNLSGTVAYLEDFQNVPTANEFIVTNTTPYVATDNIKNIYVNPVAPIATANITLPANPTNSQKVMVAIGGAITSGSVVTTLTILGTVGKDILSGDVGNPTSLVVPANSGDTFTFQYSSQLSKWVIL